MPPTMHHRVVTVVYEASPMTNRRHSPLGTLNGLVAVVFLGAFPPPYLPIFCCKVLPIRPGWRWCRRSQTRVSETVHNIYYQLLSREGEKRFITSWIVPYYIKK